MRERNERALHRKLVSQNSTDPPEWIVGIILKVLRGNMFPQRLVSILYHNAKPNKFLSQNICFFYFIFFLAMFKLNPTLP